MKIDTELVRQIVKRAANVLPGKRRDAKIEIGLWSMTHWEDPDTHGEIDFELYIADLRSDKTSDSIRINRTTLEDIAEWLEEKELSIYRRDEVLFRNFEGIVK